MIFPLTAAQSDTLALVGSTIIDVSNSGHSSQDLHNATILIRDGKILRVGSRASTPIPKHARIVDLTGKFILPGLVDGFTGLSSQSQSNANLYMGVTTVVGSQDDRRGHLLLTAHPSPHVYLLDSAGSTDEFALLGQHPSWAAKLKGRDPDLELSWDDTSRIMEEQARRGVKVLWLGHNLTKDNTLHILAKARTLGLVTYGEFIATPFSDAISAGVSVLLHISRYELGLVPPAAQMALSSDPDGPLSRKAYGVAERTALDDPRIAAYASQIAQGKVALMPTFGLMYLRLPGHRNLWNQPIASTLDPKEMFQPANRETGEPTYASAELKKNLEQRALHLWALNQAFSKQHPTYLAASGSPVFGTLPGISMHVEMELLVRLGLSPREALAAATSNYAEQFGWRELGLIAAGRRADLIVLDLDPTLDIRNSTRISQVFLDGQLLDRQAFLHAPPATH